MILTKILSFILAFILIYFSFSIFVPSKDIVGLVGYSVANFSYKYFGYLAYIYMVALLYPLYKFNFSHIENVSLKLLATFVLFVSALVFQSLVVDGALSGAIGDTIVDIFSPFIGIAGVWIFVLIGFGISFFLLFEDMDDLFSSVNLKIDFKPNIKIPNFKPSFSPKIKKENIKKEENLTSQQAQQVVIKEIGDTAEIILEDVVVEKPVEKKENIVEKDIKKDEFNPEIIEIEDLDIKIAKEDIKTIDEVEELETIPETKVKNSTIVEELEENKKLLDEIEIGKVAKPKNFELPLIEFFARPNKKSKIKINEAHIDQKIHDLLEKLRQFKIEGDVVRTYTGPIVTTFEFKPAPNVKVSKILNLQDDLAMALKATTIRIQAPIPGKDVVGIEVPNEESEIIYLREILESDIFQNSKSPLTIILGKDIVGQPFVTDLKKLPHLLVAGTTGSGKSVGINSMILSLLYKNSPDDLKLIMIDPKMLEFSMYNDIPHLLTPVITKPMEAINALANMVKEMEKRYTMMSDTRTKNIENYNEKAKANGYETFPYIVIIIDELADLMMTSGKEVELSVARLAQMARASGIHLVVATQRPSVDVVTGLIKANLPSRISYKVGQKVDSKIILDAMGAESLLGRGDMLFTPPGVSGLVRIHAPWSTEQEIDKVVEFLKEQREVQYDMSYVKDSSTEIDSIEMGDIGELDPLYESAKLIVAQDKKSSISYIQRRLKIGYNRAASIVEQLEHTGILSAANSKGNREILI